MIDKIFPIVESLYPYKEKIFGFSIVILGFIALWSLVLTAESELYPIYESCEEAKDAVENTMEPSFTPTMKHKISEKERLCSSVLR